MRYNLKKKSFFLQFLFFILHSSSTVLVKAAGYNDPSSVENNEDVSIQPLERVFNLPVRTSVIGQNTPTGGGGNTLSSSSGFIDLTNTDHVNTVPFLSALPTENSRLSTGFSSSPAAPRTSMLGAAGGELVPSPSRRASSNFHVLEPMPAVPNDQDLTSALLQERLNMLARAEEAETRITHLEQQLEDLRQDFQVLSLHAHANRNINRASTGRVSPSLLSRHLLRLDPSLGSPPDPREVSSSSRDDNTLISSPVVFSHVDAHLAQSNRRGWGSPSQIRNEMMQSRIANVASLNRSIQEIGRGYVSPSRETTASSGAEGEPEAEMLPQDYRMAQPKALEEEAREAFALMGVIAEVSRGSYSELVDSGLSRHGIVGIDKRMTDVIFFYCPSERRVFAFTNLPNAEHRCNFLGESKIVKKVFFQKIKAFKMDAAVLQFGEGFDAGHLIFANDVEVRRVFGTHGSGFGT